jgi:hypothetical protein
MQAIHTEPIGNARNPKKRKRYVQLAAPDVPALTSLPADWRQLLTQCVKNGENARWQTWQKIADISRKMLLDQMLAWLLKQGWVCVFEEYKVADWWPYRVELLHINPLRLALNLPNPDTQTCQWQAVRSALQHQAQASHDAVLQIALNSLDAMPTARAIVRAQLSQFLLAWTAEGRVGTYRDFSLYARGTTKEISATEWAWLDTHFDLAELNIQQHTPLLLIAAHVSLQTTLGEINLQTMPDFAALTPATVKTVQSVNSCVTTWILVENLTSFERVARNRQTNEGVIWLPGYPPSWWKEAVTCILKLAPAEVKIACDPDPAGIAIALSVIALCKAAGLPANTWKMGANELESLAHTKPLSAFDQQQLAALLKQDLPVELKALADYLLASQQKGEQEGYL